jgi:hypothetical protein
MRLKHFPTNSLLLLISCFVSICNSPLPHGGVFILGDLDPRHRGIIKAMLLFMSILILTCFQAVKLCISFRACQDTQYQEFLNIMQTNPVNLIDDKVKKRRFFDLMD